MYAKSFQIDYQLHQLFLSTTFLFLFSLLCVTELPVPVLGDLSEVTLLAQRLHKGSNPAKLNLTYTDICNLDTIEVNLVPEKKGIFLKHVEYQVTSKVVLILCSNTENHHEDSIKFEFHGKSSLFRI